MEADYSQGTYACNDLCRFGTWFRHWVTAQRRVLKTLRFPPTCTVMSSGAALLHHFLCTTRSQYFGNKYKGDLCAPLDFVCRDHAYRALFRMRRSHLYSLCEPTFRGGLLNVIYFPIFSSVLIFTCMQCLCTCSGTRELYHLDHSRLTEGNRTVCTCTSSVS